MRKKIIEAAGAFGFPLAGLTRLEIPSAARERMRSWLASGRHAGMRWFERSVEARCEPAKRFPWARSAVVVAGPHSAGPRSSGSSLAEPHAAGPGALRPRIAAFARGGDYHDLVGESLSRYAKLIEEMNGPGTRTRYYIDTGPLLETTLASAAGIGFIGRSRLLVTNRFGTMVHLGVILTNIGIDDEPRSEAQGPGSRCGDCKRCIEACPTGAIDPDEGLDAGRCISYLTIEKRGGFTPEERRMVGGWLVGCDICQEVCPFNRAAWDNLPAPLNPGFAEDEAVDLFLGIEREEFAARFGKTVLSRPGWEGMRRNAEAVAGNMALGREDTKV